MAKRVALLPISEVCAGENRYKGRGHRMDIRWNQEAVEKQLRTTLAKIQREEKWRYSGDKDNQ